MAFAKGLIKRLGYGLEKFWPEEKFEEFKDLWKDVGYQSGILFYGNKDPEEHPEEHLNRFLETISWKPRRVFLVDVCKNVYLPCESEHSSKFHVSFDVSRIDLGGCLAPQFYASNTPFLVVNCLNEFDLHQNRDLTSAQRKRAKLQIGCFQKTFAMNPEKPFWPNDRQATEMLATWFQSTKSNQPKSSTEPNPE